jgi:murein DD-endopeptidase MepM/ murein hydrolase activator NlpD
MFNRSNDNIVAGRLFHTGRKFLSSFLGLAAFGMLCAAAPAQAETAGTDAGFSNLFQSMQKLDKVETPDTVQPTPVYIPSGRPVDKLSLTSNFGVRTDPFNGEHKMHKGIDIPGPMGTPIYATADGTVGRAQWVSGYGNYVEIGHGSGLETRYGHMSRLVAISGQRVRRGELIGYMGSTGRSTGSHLHYEVRVEGQAVNPVPFIQGTDYLLALNTRPPIAMGGPDDGSGDD